MSACNCAYTPPESKPCLHCRELRFIEEDARRIAINGDIQDRHVRRLADHVGQLARHLLARNEESSR